MVEGGEGQREGRRKQRCGVGAVPNPARPERKVEIREGFRIRGGQAASINEIVERRIIGRVPLPLPVSYQDRNRLTSLTDLQPPNQ